MKYKTNTKDEIRSIRFTRKQLKDLTRVAESADVPVTSIVRKSVDFYLSAVAQKPQNPSLPL